jgi:1,4-dihydroxy-2-naphthoate octaprenyltransferase
VVGIFAIEAAKNASGEIFDWDLGTDARVAPADRTPFSGGKRVLVDGLLSRAGTWMVAAAGYLVFALAGAAIIAWREPRVLWLGVAGIALAFFYHAPPLRLSCRGLGEIAVALAYGPLIAAGTYLVQRGQLPARVLALGVPLGFAIAAFLWINEFPDSQADASSGKRTLVVKLGRPAAARAFGWIFALAFGLQALLPILGFPVAVWLGLVAALPALAAVRILRAAPEESAKIIPAQGLTLLSFLALSAGTAAGLIVPS